jgi:hypothetical protein
MGPVRFLLPFDYAQASLSASKGCGNRPPAAITAIGKSVTGVAWCMLTPLLIRGPTPVGVRADSISCPRGRLPRLPRPTHERGPLGASVRRR